MRVSSRAEKQNRTGRKESGRVRLKPEQSISVSTLVKYLRIVGLIWNQCAHETQWCFYELTSTVVFYRQNTEHRAQGATRSAPQFLQSPQRRLLAAAAAAAAAAMELQSSCDDGWLMHRVDQSTAKHSSFFFFFFLNFIHCPSTGLKKKITFVPAKWIWG